jgi:hypothetical protein
MLTAMRAHADGADPSYESRFRLRSNGSGYRSVHSRGRVIERNAEGRAVRMVGTMLDLTERPPTPQGGLPEGLRGAMQGSPLVLPFHVLLSGERHGTEAERQRLLGLVDDLLLATLAQLEGSRT